MCGRDSRRVPGYPNPHISQINVNLGNLSSGLSITWSRETTETRALPSSFPISPGAGLCTTCCDDRAASRNDGSLCTPKGDFEVNWISGRNPHCQLGNTSWAHNATYFAGSIRSGIAIHKGPSTNMPPRPGYPASHGCVRTTEDGSAIIHDNSVAEDTVVQVDGTWSGTHCYDSIREGSAHRRRGSERCGSSAEAETRSSETKLALVQPRAVPEDGAGPA